MRRIYWIAVFLLAGQAIAAQTSEDDLQMAYQEHLGYVGAMYQVFLDSPQVHDAAKFAVSQYGKEILSNTSLTVAYESKVLSTKGEICRSPVSNRIPEFLRFSDTTKAPVMFMPGDVIFVNAAYFRDLCVLYKRAPERVSDLYRQHMAQIKSTTGGMTYEELKKQGQAAQN